MSTPQTSTQVGAAIAKRNYLLPIEVHEPSMREAALTNAVKDLLRFPHGSELSFRETCEAGEVRMAARELLLLIGESP